MKMIKYWVLQSKKKVGEFGSIFDYNEKQLQNLAEIKAKELERPLTGIEVVRQGIYNV